MYQSRRLRLRAAQLKQVIISNLVKIVFIGGIVSFILILILFSWLGRNLPSPTKLSSSSNSTVFFDRNDKIIYQIFKDKNRLPVAINDIPSHLKNATIAIEDKNFYKHKGISEFGIIRGFFNIALGRGLQSGSTITQQLIKNVLLTSKQTITRKVQEMILAFQVERKYKKDEILQMYLNEAPYGGSYWGVGTAAKGYFDKSVKDLTLLESAFLAGLPQSPSRYSPFIGEKDLWKGRTTDVLRRMREDGYITRVQEKDSLSRLNNLKFTTPKLAINAPHFVFYNRDKIAAEYSEKLIEDGIKVKTTIDLEVQKKVEKIVNEEILNLKDYQVTNGAVVVLDTKTGEILAMVGSYDYNDNDFGKFNAALGMRQPGSTVKPITYATAFEKGYTPSTVIMDVKTEFTTGLNNDKPYTPVNYDGKYRGPMQIRFALGNSENVPAVKILAMVGIKEFLQKAYDMGLDSFAPTTSNLNRFGLSIALGGGETTLLDLTSAFSVFASGGKKRETSSILEITDYHNKKIFKKVKVKDKQVLSPEVSFLISHILSDNNARAEVFGLNSYLNIPGKTVAAKTGTTDDKRDNWAVGFTKSITVGVWVGNNDNSKMNPKIASGATGASPIFYKIMRELLAMKQYEDGIIDKPNSVEAIEIDAYLGGLPVDGQPKRSEYFIKGTEPKDIASYYKKLKISKSNNKLANEVEIKSGNYDEKDYIVLTENDPISLDGKNRWQEAINNWLKDQSNEKLKPPTEVSDASSDSVIVSIKNPMGQTTISSGNLNIKAKIASGEKIKNIKIKLNGSEIKSLDGDRKEIDETISITTDGVYELQIIATNEKDKQGESTIKFGVNKPWDYVEPTEALTLTPSPTP